MERGQGSKSRGFFKNASTSSENRRATFSTKNHSVVDIGQNLPTEISVMGDSCLEVSDIKIERPTAHRKSFTPVLLSYTHVTGRLARPLLSQYCRFVDRFGS
jgi:hypothetical protein